MRKRLWKELISLNSNLNKETTINGTMHYKTEGVVYGELSIDVSNYSTVIVRRVSATAVDYGLTVSGNNFTTVTYFSNTEHELEVSDVTTLRISLKAPVVGYSLDFKIKLVK